MILATSIEFFKNIAQYHYNHRYYDFHNDYNCEKICFSDGVLLIKLKSLFDDVLLSLKFTDVEMMVMEFFNVNEVEGLTIDNLYRGRYEYHNELIEVSEGRGYFYLEFYEGQKLEFWAKSVGLV